MNGDGIVTLLEFAVNLDPKKDEFVLMEPGTGTRGLPFVRREEVGGSND